MSERKAVRGLTEDELEWMCARVDKSDSDFDDNEEVEGWVNYSIQQQADGELPILTVTFQDSEEPTSYKTARYILVPLDNKLEVDE